MFHRMPQGLCLTLLLFVLSAHATIRYVDGVTGFNHYSTLALAYTAAVNGDTLLISPNTYQESLGISKQLTIIGSGHDNTVMTGTLSIDQNGSGTMIVGISILVPSIGNGNCVTLQAGATNITFRNCYIRALTQGNHSNGYVVRRNGSGVGCNLDIIGCLLVPAYSYYNSSTRILALNGDNVAISGTLFAANNQGGSSPSYCAIGGTSTGLTITNSCFLGLGIIFDLSGVFPLLCANNLFYDWTSNPNYGIFPQSGTWEFNASSLEEPPGDDGITLISNPFIAYDVTANFNYDTTVLHFDSMNGIDCIDRGQPYIQDIDGSRSDVGMYGGPTPFSDTGAPAYPFVSQLAVPSAITAGQPLPVSSTGRIGREY